LTRNSGQVTRTVQNTHDGDGFLIRPIIDGVGSMKNDAQPGRKLWAFRVCQREGQQPLTGGGQLAKKRKRVAVFSEDCAAM